jgi:(2Fe-2S) ferredoxin
MKYPFERHVLVCTGGRCNAPANGEDRGEVIRSELKDLNRRLGNKARVRVCSTSCLDLCDYGPNIVVWPQGRVYSHLDRDSARRVYLGEIGEAPLAEDKLLDPEEMRQEEPEAEPALQPPKVATDR